MNIDSGFDRAVRFAKMAMFAGCNGEAVPEELYRLGDGGLSMCLRYYEAGAAIRRRTTTQHIGSAVMRPDDGKTRSTY